MTVTACFITGTDTEIGKTLVALGLMVKLGESHARVVGMKPVASGASRVNGVLCNEDALLLQSRCTETTNYELINPFVYAKPIAPHIAASETGEDIDLGWIAACYAELSSRADAIVVEGAGGWRAPLGEEHSMADLVAALDIPVILVVGLRLGCINHGLLSAEAIVRDGQRLAGWVANHPAPGYRNTGETLAYLESRIPAALLGHVPCLEEGGPERVAGCFDSRIADILVPG